MADSHVETVTVAGEGITIPLLVWRRFGRQMPGLVERIIDGTPGLADAGILLPIGAVVRIPIPMEPEQGAPQVEERISLW